MAVLLFHGYVVPALKTNGQASEARKRAYHIKSNSKVYRKFKVTGPLQATAQRL